MNSVKFLHLSDPHISAAYENSKLAEYIAKYGKSPAGFFEEAMAYFKKKYSELDFIVITGDLAHKATEENYGLFKSIIEKGPEVPVFCVMGNHDSPGPFRKVFNISGKSSPKYYYEENIKGIRILGLDSHAEGFSNGELGREQIDWLKSRLKEKTELGSVILVHHGPSIGIHSGYLKDERELYECIKNSDVKVVFAGHRHKNSVWSLGHIPCFTAGSLAFGISFSEDFDMADMTDKKGYNYCILGKSDIYAEHNGWPDKNIFIHGPISWKKISD